MRTGLQHVIARSLTLVGILWVFAAAHLEPPTLPTRFRIVQRLTVTSADAPFYYEGTASHRTTKAVHSAAMVELDSGAIRAFWYGGTREGARDISIYSSVFNPVSEIWSMESVVVTREALQDDLFRSVKKIGNPVVVKDTNGRLWLFFVSVSVGGWSGSAINVITSDNDGKTWGTSRRLITSPFLNISTLVKGVPYLFDNGTIGLPVYHEFLGKFSEMLQLDLDGRVVSKQRLSSGRSFIQPEVVPMSEYKAVVYLRPTGSSPRRIWTLGSLDGGITWGKPQQTSFSNPDAALSAIWLGGEQLVLAFNDSETNRSNLSLAYSKDGGESWEVFHRVEPPDSSSVGRYAYPSLLKATDGGIHLLYTWNRQSINHVRFNEAWIRSQL